jgi:protein gp37
MGKTTKIEWTDSSWNPIRARNLKTSRVGWYCEHATTGCEFCYAERLNIAFGTGLPFKPGHRNDVEIFLDEKMLTAPLRWKKPSMVFVCSMTDLFADFVRDEWIEQIFAAMLETEHRFQVLTKRPERMNRWVKEWLAGISPNLLENIWLGVSCERQEEADERIPLLLDTPATIRFVSAEPLLGPIDFTRWMDGISWIICGGESGPGNRLMEPVWARSIRDQCNEAGVAFFMKQMQGKRKIPDDLMVREWPIPIPEKYPVML